MVSILLSSCNQIKWTLKGGGEGMEATKIEKWVVHVHLLHVEIYTLDDTVKMSYLSGQFFLASFVSLSSV